MIGVLVMSAVFSALPSIAEPGASREALTAALAGQGAEWLDVRAPQALRVALLDSGLLETMNHFGAAPAGDGALDPGRLSELVRFERDGKKHVLLLAGGVVRWVLVTIPVPVDTSADPPAAWSRERLGPLRRALAALGPLTPVSPDARGNVFQWRRKAGRGQLAAWYLPERDELRVLLW